MGRAIRFAVHVSNVVVPRGLQPARRIRAFPALLCPTLASNDNTVHLTSRAATPTLVKPEAQAPGTRFRSSSTEESRPTPSLRMLYVIQSFCHPSHFGNFWLLSSYSPADFCCPRHTRCCISEPGWVRMRPGEAPPQRRDLPAKLFDNKTLHITPLFVLLYL